MSWLVHAGVTAALALAAAAPKAAVPPALVFAPSQCNYVVSFPWQPAISQSTAMDGGMNVAADLVHGSVRYSAACLAVAPGRSGPAAAPPPAEARMTEMAHALGVQHPTIRPLTKLGTGCGEVDGFLGDGAQPYRIAARICIAAGSTFIAETIARAGAEDPAAGKFLDTLAPKQALDQ